MDRFTCERLFEKIALPAEAVAVFYEIKEQILPYFEEIAADLFAKKNIGSKIAELSEKLGICTDQINLALCILASERTYGIYRERGIDEAIFFDTMTDLTIWVKVCRRDWNCWGLHEFGWLQNHIRASLFRLGRLQFELVPFRYDSYTKNGHTVKKGDTVMNIHIPEGEDLKKEKRLDSYRRAHEFFGLDTFVCDTWLFYPRHTEFLQPDSNILDFMRDFDIIDSKEYPSTDNLWRIWGRRESYVPSELPRDTGMRRAYADWLEKTGMVGSGYGVFFYEDIR